MPKSKQNDEPKILTALLLKSKALSEYQPDFAKVMLTDEAYTLTEAKAILESVKIRKE